MNLLILKLVTSGRPISALRVQDEQGSNPVSAPPTTRKVPPRPGSSPSPGCSA